MFIKLKVKIGVFAKFVLIPVNDILYILEDEGDTCSVHIKSGRYFTCVDKINSVENALTVLQQKHS